MLAWNGIQSVDTSFLTAIFLAVTASYFALNLLYNAFLHPLHKFPGPKIAGATRYYLLYYQFIGEKHTLVERLHEKYGEIVRVAPDQLSFINESAWKEIYSYRGKDRVQMQKGDGRGPRKGVPTHIINASDEAHARQRKILSVSFSDRNLREQEPLLLEHISELEKVIRRYAEEGRPTDMTKYFEFLTSDIISDFCFTASFGQLQSGQQEPLIGAMHKFVPVETKLAVLPKILRYSFIFGYLRPGLLRTLMSSQKQVRDRLERRTDDKDMMKQVIRHITDDGTGISMEELAVNTSILMLAGSETTATALAGAMFYLGKSPPVLDRLLKEIRGHFNVSHEISLAKVNQLPYLSAVVEETLRIYSPIPVALTRITPPEGASICGHWIPGGITVGIPHRAAFRSSRNFADPHSFRPERWLPDKPGEFKADVEAVLQPFQTGPRNCLGMGLAYAELKLVLSRLLFSFDFELVDRDSKWNEQQVYVLYQKPPLMMHVKTRA